MSDKRIALLFWTVMLCVIGLFAVVHAAGAVPGTEGDPVVTKSYVDEKIGEVMSAVGGSGGVSSALNSDELMAQIEYAVKAQVQKSQGTAFTPVSVEMGQTLYGGEGCELILRSGAGFIVTSTDTVVNATSGADLKHGANVPKGNLLIFPRDDGRGVKATDRCWFMVKGNYNVR